MNNPKMNEALPQNETPKQPYEKPAMIYRAPLEATAGQCTPQPPGKAGPSQECTTIQS